jgi:hypothetical protein
MSHIHWVARQDKLDIPNDEEEVNMREIHKCDGQAHDPDTMVAPLTPKPTRKAEALFSAPSYFTTHQGRFFFGQQEQWGHARTCPSLEIQCAMTLLKEQGYIDKS